MLQVTESAIALLSDALQNERSDNTQVFRLMEQDEQFVLGIGEVKPDDVEFTRGGDTVLAAPTGIANDSLGDATIDAQTTPEGPKLVVTGPED